MAPPGFSRRRDLAPRAARAGTDTLSDSKGPSDVGSTRAPVKRSRLNITGPTRAHLCASDEAADDESNSAVALTGAAILVEEGGEQLACKRPSRTRSCNSGAFSGGVPALEP